MAQILFPIFEQVIVAPIHTARAAALDDLLAAARATGTPAVAAQSSERGAADGAGSFSGRRGGRVGVGVPGGRGARAAAGWKERIVMSARPNPLPLLSRGRSNVLQAPLLLLVTAVCGTAALVVSVVDKKRHGRSIASRGCGRALRCGFRCQSLLSRARRTFISTRSPSTPATTRPTWTRRSSLPRCPSSSASWPRRSCGSMPFIGWYLERSGQMPIDTVNPHATLSSLGEGVKALRAGHAAVRLS